MTDLGPEADPPPHPPHMATQPPTFAGAWLPPTAPRPPLARPKRRSGVGCGPTAAIFLGIVAVIAVLGGGAVAAVRWRQSNDPAHRRAERIDALADVCTGTGIGSVPAYHRTAAGEVGARVDEDAIRWDHENTVTPFPLVPGPELDPDAVLDATLALCTASVATESTSCSFDDPSRPRNFDGSGNTSADWPTTSRTDVKLVEVHSGAVLDTFSFETENGCPGSLRVSEDGGYTPRLPTDEIARQAETRAALFHQG